MAKIDFYCAAEERYAVWWKGEDAAMFEIVSTINIACGGHADHVRFYCPG